MARKRAGAIFGVVILVIVLVLAWVIIRPGPLAFADGKRLALAEYSGKPTGVPADFQDTDPLARGQVPGRRRGLRGLPHGRARHALRRQPALRHRLRHPLFAQHHAGSRDRHRRVERCGVPAGHARRHRQGRQAALPRLPVRLLHAPHRRGRAGDQGVPVQPAAAKRTSRPRTRCARHTTSAG